MAQIPVCDGDSSPHQKGRDDLLKKTLAWVNINSFTKGLNYPPPLYIYHLQSNVPRNLSMSPVLPGYISVKMIYTLLWLWALAPLFPSEYFIYPVDPCWFPASTKDAGKLETQYTFHRGKEAANPVLHSVEGWEGWCKLKSSNFHNCSLHLEKETCLGWDT